MMLMTGMSIDGRMSVGVVISTNGVASRIMMAITMNVYGRLRARLTIHIEQRAGVEGEGAAGPCEGRTRMVENCARRVDDARMAGLTELRCAKGSTPARSACDSNTTRFRGNFCFRRNNSAVDVFAHQRPSVADIVNDPSQSDPPLSEVDLQAFVDGTLASPRAVRVDAYLRQRPREASRIAFYDWLNSQICSAFPLTDQSLLQAPNRSMWGVGC